MNKFKGKSQGGRNPAHVAAKRYRFTCGQTPLNVTASKQRHTRDSQRTGPASYEVNWLAEATAVT